jgi:phosphoribosylanthranilate isomerase
MTVIKICGITNLDDALAAVKAGADYLGFNFYPKSPRCIDADTCAKITSVLAAEHPNIRLVGVFVNAPVLDVLAVLQSCALDLAQLHGDEGSDMLRLLGSRAFKAYRGVPEIVNGFKRVEPPACLIDASVKGVYGGTGVTADWTAAAKLAKQHPLFLAGGLTPDNVGEAVQQVLPWGVDTASGVEARPGVKDSVKMKDFMQAVRVG